jgi:hypothetical protein
VFLILIISSYFLLFILVGCGDLTVQGFVHFSSPVNYNLTTIFGSNITIGFFAGFVFIAYKILQFAMIYLSIAITTSEWTACEAHKHGRKTHFSRFAL